MLPNSIFEVTRNEYMSFVEQIKPECREIKIMQIDERHEATKTYSRKTGKCLCSRTTYVAKYGDPEPEMYYIFEMPEDDERQAAIPKYQLKLESREEVQAFFDFISQQLNKEKKND